jgi:hypothetical protein
MLVLGIEKDCIANGFCGSVGRFEFVAKEIGDVEDVRGTGDGGGIGGIQNVIDGNVFVGFSGIGTGGFLI